MSTERLTKKEAALKAELERRKSASQRAADKLLDPRDEKGSIKGWEPFAGKVKVLIPAEKPTRVREDNS